ncbi:Protein DETOXIFICATION [Quillaja saponaria]|uniref:Protein DETOXIFICATION n=1 Tax=Quillaja saponaria TaxID=32244 RepID=A0AAD7PY06_QUISA|nr:Protein DETOXIFICATION [Quillaja saponaria]
MGSEAMEMEELPENERRKWMIPKDAFMQELKKASIIAAPMVAVTVLQYLLQVVSVIMVGHLGQLSLSSVAIATSLTNVFGFSILSGMAGALETLCGQAYGAEQYKKLGTYTYTAIISLTLVSSPVCILWIFMDKLLPLIGQDPEISLEAKKYSMWLIPALFGSAILKSLTRYLQTQSLTLPMLLTSSVILCFHILTCWIMVYKLELGHIGAAIAFSLSTWVNVIMLVFYVKYSSACEKTRTPFSKDALLGTGEFFRLAVPSAVMVCLKWWSCEVLILLAGLFSNPKLETSVLSICLTISTLHFTIPYGIGAAASTRVSNELGAGNPQAARVAVSAAMFLAVTEAVIVSITLFCCRDVLGCAYSNERHVVDYVAAMSPLLCLSVFMDSLQAILSGVARGSGWQKLGAYVNLGAFYLLGIPVGVSLGFLGHLRGKGLWIGLVTGSAVQSIFLSLITAFTNWRKHASKARERTFDGKSSAADGQN